MSITSSIPSASLPTAAPVTASAAAGAAEDASKSNYVRNEAIITAGKKTLDLVRSAAKLPEAARNGKLGSALLQTVTMSPSSHLIDPNAPAVATAESAGRSFTAFDKVAYRAAAGIDVGIGAFKLANGVPNLVKAVKQDGAAGVVGTRVGRDGVLQTASGALTLGLFGRAAGVAKAAGVSGAVPIALAAATSETLAAPWVIGTYIGATGLVLANEHGFLDFMNTGNTQSVGQVEKTAWDQLGVKQHLSAITGQAASLGTQAASTSGQAATATASASSSLANKVGTVVRGWMEHGE